MGRDSHHLPLSERLAQDAPAPETDDPLEKMAWYLKTKEGKARYAKRKSTVELDAIWKFNLDATEIERMSRMSLEELKELAECGRAIFTILPVTVTPSTTPSNILAALLPVTTHV